MSDNSLPTIIVNSTNMNWVNQSVNLYYYIFTSTTYTNTITFTKNTICEVLVVGGGGNGSSGTFSGGGGAGEVVYHPYYLFPSGIYTITVGDVSNNSTIKDSSLTTLFLANKGGGGGYVGGNGIIIPTCVGGTTPQAVSGSSSDYYIKFTSGGNNTIMFPVDTICQIFMIGGGGIGGSDSPGGSGGGPDGVPSGGGGAGAYYQTNYTFLANITYTIAIGSGGSSYDTNGGDTFIKDNNNNIIFKVLGGGAGGTYATAISGHNGGCGGGASQQYGIGYSIISSTNTNGIGFNGGNYIYDYDWIANTGKWTQGGGGGGGCGGPGYSCDGNASANGGDAINITITGTDMVVGGGGAGIGKNKYGSYVYSVGGSYNGIMVGGGYLNGVYANAVANTGSGGFVGGKPGSAGLFIIRYNSNNFNPSTGGSGGGGSGGTNIQSGASSTSSLYPPSQGTHNVANGTGGSASKGGDGGSVSYNFLSTTYGVGGTGATSTSTPITKTANTGNGGDGNGGIGASGVVIFRIKYNYINNNNNNINIITSNCNLISTTLNTSISSTGSIANGYYGTSCSIDKNNKYMVVGAWGENSTSGSQANNTGAAFIYTSTGDTTWGTPNRFTSPSPVSNGYFGCSCYINNYVMIIGACGENSTAGSQANYAGAAYVYTYDGTTWLTNPQRLISNSPVANGYFGYSCTMNNSNIIISAKGENSTAGSTANNAGAVYVYTYINNTLKWQYSQRLISSSPVANGNFGCSCAINSNYLVIGATGESTTPGNTADNSGAAYLSTLTSINPITWNNPTRLNYPSQLPTINSFFGNSCAISSNFIAINSCTMSSTATPNTNGIIYPYSYNNYANFIPKFDLPANVLIVGGGGDGGGDGTKYIYGGGGGGGQVLFGTYNFSTNTNYKINVGVANNASSISSSSLLFLANQGGIGGSTSRSISFANINGGGGAGFVNQAGNTNTLTAITQSGVSLITQGTSSSGLSTSGGTGASTDFNFNGNSYGLGGIGAVGSSYTEFSENKSTGTGGNGNGGVGSSGTIIIAYNCTASYGTNTVSTKNIINIANTFFTDSSSLSLSTTNRISNIANKYNISTKPIRYSSLNKSFNYIYNN